MSKGSIYDKNWLDLVFDGKNKKYGAYQLRQQNGKTTIMAFFTGIGFIAGIVGLGMAISSFNSTTVIDNPSKPDDIRIHVVKIFVKPKKEEPKTPKTILPLKKEKITEKVNSRELVHPTIVKSDEHPDEIIKNKDLKDHPTDTNNGKEHGIIGPNNTTNSNDTKPSITDGGEKKPGEILTTNLVDKMPEFPGGLKKLSEYIANNIEKPETESNQSSISVIMSFVVEKDGSMTDIKVLRSTDKELEKAAIKVLKSIKVKWSPGMYNGEPVRTQYIQPIRVNL